MKVLFLEWNSYCNDFVKAEMMRRGYELVLFDFPQNTEDTRMSEALSSQIAMKALETGVDIIFSLNYYPVAAIAAHACKMKYVSWTYDSPFIQLYSKTIEFPTNYAFIFDRYEYDRLRALGISTVYYLPMAAPTHYFDRVSVSAEEHAKYDAKVAMVGSMYTEQKHQMMRHFEKADSYVKGFLDAVIQAQKNVYGVDIMEPALTDSIVQKIQTQVPIFAHGDGLETESWVISNYFLARKLTSIERFEFLHALSEQYPVSLYTYEPTPALPKVDNRGSVTYYEEMSKAMKCAKINLNITLRSIVTGIPLRAFDIMGNGGFLMTSYQADFLEFFEPDKDFVYYENLEDLVEKTGFYLTHDKVRETIAKNGYEKVKKYHTYQNRFDEIEKIIGET